MPSRLQGTTRRKRRTKVPRRRRGDVDSPMASAQTTARGSSRSQGKACTGESGACSRRKRHGSKRHRNKNVQHNDTWFNGR